MVKHQLPKLRSGVRFPSPAPYGNDASVEFFSADASFYIIPCHISCHTPAIAESRKPKNGKLRILSNYVEST